MLCGYARVSTDDQDLTLQRRMLVEHGCERVYEEKMSGARRDRPELARLFDQLRAGDVLVVVRLDRLARSTLDLLGLVERLRALEAGLRSLHEPWADTTTPAGRMVLTVFGGIAEFERELIRARTGAGQRAARAAGIHCGRPAKLSAAQLAFAREELERGRPLSHLARLIGVHPSTLARSLARAGAGPQQADPAAASLPGGVA